MLILGFLGKVQIEYNGVNIVGSLRNKTIALICILALNHGKSLNRERIVDYLWPDSNEDAARYNLRYNLWLIKKSIGLSENKEEFLIVKKDCCGINPKYPFSCDIIEIMQSDAYHEMSIERIVHLKEMVKGDFLEGYYFNNCDDFNEVILFERAKFENAKTVILKRLVTLYEKSGKVSECLKLLKEILETEPYDEEVAYKILGIYETVGNRASGVVFFNQFRDNLMGKLGVSPSEKLWRKNEELKACQEPVVEAAGPGEAVIKVRCMKGVRFFWMSEVVAALFDYPGLGCDGRLHKHLLTALTFIRPDICKTDYSEVRGVPDVQIAGAFVQLIQSVCQDYKLIILTADQDLIDMASENVMDYLKRLNIKNLHFSESNPG